MWHAAVIGLIRTYPAAASSAKKITKLFFYKPEKQFLNGAYIMYHKSLSLANVGFSSVDA
jgi:hypothetical protein